MLKRHTGSYRRRQQRKRLCLLAAGVLLICVLFGYGCISRQDKTPALCFEAWLSADTLSNVCNEPYLELQPTEWMPANAVQNTTAAAEAATDTTTTTTTATDAAPSSEETPVGDKPYPTEWDVQEDCSIIRTTFNAYAGEKFIDLPAAGQVANHTELPNSQLLTEASMPPAFNIAVNDQPQVLIMHTHTSEAYEPYVREHYDPNFNYRTTDPSANVVAVGDAITEKLEAAGIGVIHSTTVHDYPSYNGAYDRSAETVRAILEEHPSIRVVLDIHRDALCTDTTITQPYIEVNGKEAAQIMIISGCDDGTFDMPDYLFNFRFACRLQQQEESMYPGLTRPILFDYRKYNQDLTKGSLLIEVGTHGNTLDQAIYAGSLFGDALTQVLLDLH